jgi:hypothetical protein
VILFKPRTAWTEELSQKSGLCRDTVSAILDDLVYDPALYQKGAVQANIASQPFFPVGNGELALSNILVIPSDAERNIWELVSIKRPTVFSTAESEKEEQWAKTVLVPWLNKLGYGAWPNTKFDNSEELRGDVDLFVLDRNSNFALAIELKWLKAQHTLKDLGHINERLVYAVEQASRSDKWLRTCPQQILQKTGLTSAEFRALRLAPLVVSRASLGGPSVHSLTVPIINEFLAHLILDAPHKRNLEELLKVARNRSYLPKYGRHFVLDSWEESYAGIRFRSHLSPKILKEWDSLTDIAF